MADGDPPILPAADVAPPASAPVAQEPLVSAAPAAAATEVVAPVAAEAPKLEEPKLAPTLLEKSDAERKAKDDAAAKPAEPVKDAKPEVKPGEKPAEVAAEKPKDDAAKAPEAAKPEAAAPIDLTAHAFTLPEVLKADDAQIGEFKSLLQEALTKPAEAGQKLLDMHASAMTNFATQVRKEQYDTFNTTKAGWEKQILADPEIGGAGHQTASAAIARARDNLISSARPGTPKYQADLKEFEEFQAVTGAGSHPVFWRMLHNAARYLDEPGLPAADPKPPASNGRSGGRLSQVLHDNPRSRVQRS